MKGTRVGARGEMERQRETDTHGRARVGRGREGEKEGCALCIAQEFIKSG